MGKVAKIRISGRENKKTTCESYVLVGVDDTNKIDTKWLVLYGGTNGISVSVRMMAQLALCGQAIGESLLQAYDDLEQGDIQLLVENAMDMIRKREAQNA